MHARPSESRRSIPMCPKCLPREPSAWRDGRTAYQEGDGDDPAGKLWNGPRAPGRTYETKDQRAVPDAKTGYWVTIRGAGGSLPAPLFTSHAGHEWQRNGGSKKGKGRGDQHWLLAPARGMSPWLPTPKARILRSFAHRPGMPTARLWYTVATRARDHIS